MGFNLTLDEGYKSKSTKSAIDPGNSEVTHKEKSLIQDIEFMDNIMDYRESVHGNMSARETVPIDSLKSLGRITLPPVNRVESSSGMT
jgi:hypothetical protein